MHPLWGAFLFYYVRLDFILRIQTDFKRIHTNIYFAHPKKNVILHKRKTT